MEALASGAEVRRTGPDDGLPVVCLSGGSGGLLPGDWGGSIELLVSRLAPRFPGLRFHEVRYRVKSWNRLEMCIEDAHAALDAASDPHGRSTLVIGFSMGGAVAIGSADHPDVTTVVGLAPWIPDRMPIEALLRGRRLAVVHGSLDGWLPGIPGVSPASSRRGYERARTAGVAAEYELIQGALHPIALRTPRGLLPMPRAGVWTDRVAAQLERFRAAAAQPGIAA